MRHLSGTNRHRGGSARDLAGVTRHLEPRARALGWGAAAAVGLVAAALSVTTWRSWPGWGVQEVSEGMGFLALAASTGVAWWLVTVLVGAAAEVGGAPRSDSPLRSRVAAWLLAAAAVGAAAPAHAAPATTVVAAMPASPTGDTSPRDGFGAMLAVELPGGDGDVAGARAGDVPEPGWTPTPPPEPSPHRLPGGDVGLVSSRPADRPGTLGTDGVTVRAGDTLWDIAASHLGPEATDEDIAEAWPRWYSANRDLIGPDPDHILPGQLLTIPTGAVR
ncbi:LysM peptidoglycan-binding domain-containing protein [Ornithinimicrobium panacihumi]|uniref:LysM peptidoglycan-binding domain-containing protein n=1 Tax=Ornithinimicrobium panacihumi TaxID=2008449 RepID=UPI003F891A80